MKSDDCVGFNAAGPGLMQDQIRKTLNSQFYLRGREGKTETA